MVVIVIAMLVSGEGPGDRGSISIDEAAGNSAAGVAPIDQGAAASDEGAAASDEQGTPGDQEAIESLARRSIEVLPAGQWPSLYDSYSSEFQQRCPREEFDQAGVDAAIELGDDLRLLRFNRLESLMIEGSSAQAVIVGEIAGLGEYQIQAAFQKADGDWKLAPTPNTQGCQAFLSS